MTHFHRINIPKTSGVYLTDREILKLLMQNKEIYKTGLERGKIFGRADSKKKQYAKKLADHESDTLNNFF